MTGSLSLFLLMASAIAGELCVERACTTTSLLPLASQVVPVTQSEKSRAFTWVARDGSDAVVGTIQARENVFVDRSTKSEMLIGVQTRYDRLPAFEIAVSRRDGTASWNIAIKPKDSRHELRLHAPPGDYDVVVRPSSDRMEPENAVAVKVAAGETSVVPGWKLIRQLRGTVFEARTRKPIPQAEVEGADGTLLAVADEEGQFVVDDPQPPMQRDLTVHAPGFGTRWVDLQLDAKEVGVVELFRGSTVILKVEHPVPGKVVPLDIRLNESEQEGGRVLAKQKGTTGEQIELVDVPPGAHRLFVSGPKALQHHSRTLDVFGSKVEAAVMIEPVEVQGMVIYGDEVLPEATVEIKGDGGWRGEVRTDEAGAFGGEMWDQGDLMLAVTATKLNLPYMTMSRGGKTNPRFLDIRIPATVVRGTVTADGRAVTGARVKMHSSFEEIEYGRGVRTGKEGQFEFSGVPAGQHTLTIAADGFLEASVEIETEADDTTREMEIKLERGRDLVVEVRSEDGRRLQGALIAVGLDPDGVHPEMNAYTDADGRARLTIRPSTVKNLFVVDGVGRFAQAVLSPDSPAETTIIIPSGEGALFLTVLDTDGEPVPDVGLAVRFNGMPLPQLTLAMMLRARQTSAVTGRDGTLLISRLPAGRYELFPGRTSTELGRVLRSPIARKAPIDVPLDGRSAIPITVRIKKLEADVRSGS